MQLVKIALVSDMGVAMVVNSLLESEGCHVLETGSGHLARSGATQGCYIIVEDSDTDKAISILKERGFADFLIDGLQP
ncbi:MAG: hypothetical protein R8M46_09035 [Ghiorsea sp.]